MRTKLAELMSSEKHLKRSPWFTICLKQTNVIPEHSDDAFCILNSLVCGCIVYNERPLPSTVVFRGIL